MGTKIGKQDGIVAAINRLRDFDPAGTLLVKTAGKWPDISTLPADVSTWKAYDKLQRTLQILKDDHDLAAGGGSSTDHLVAAQARIFLAQEPLEALLAPPFMVPVCTADPAYRSGYTPDAIAQLRARFGHVEAWADCHATPFGAALDMVDELELDGAWGQCETTEEFDAAYAAGARRMIGSLGVDVLDDERLARVASAEVLVAAELYRNVMPWVEPDYRGANAGVGGNAIGCYASDSEGAVYTPVSDYKALGFYVAGRDSVFGVGLQTQDWLDLG